MSSYRTWYGNESWLFIPCCCCHGRESLLSRLEKDNKQHSTDRILSNKKEEEEEEWKKKCTAGADRINVKPSQVASGMKNVFIHRVSAQLDNNDYSLFLFNIISYGFFENIFYFFFFLILLTEGDAWSVLRCAMWGGKSGAERRRRRRRRMPTVPGGKTPVRRRLPNWEDVRRSLKIRNQFSPLSQYRVGRSVYSRQSRTSESLLCVPEVELTLDVYRERIIERESIFFVPPFKELNQRIGKKGTEKKKMTGHRRRHGGGSSSSSSWSNVRLLLFILLASTNKAVVKADNLGKNKSPFNYFFRLNKKNKKRTRTLREMRVIRNWRMQDKEGRKEEKKFSGLLPHLKT